MKRLILVITLLTASVAFGHESENDPKHNAIHDSYVGKICHAHSYGNAGGAVRGDFHDHENSYKFSDASHNQKLSDYYLDLHDVNNPDNFNERGELYFDHGLHTPDYVVTPIVQSNGKSVGNSVESTPDVDLRSNTYIPKPLLITYIAYTNPVLTLRFKAVENQTRHNYLVIRVNGQDWTTPALFFGRYYLLADAMREVSLTAHPNGKSVLTLTRMPYVQIISGKAYMQAERTAGHAYGWLSIAEFDMSDFTVSLLNYGSKTERDSVTHADIDADGNRIGTVAGAPSLRKPKLTTMWATLKKQQ